MDRHEELERRRDDAISAWSSAFESVLELIRIGADRAEIEDSLRAGDEALERVAQIDRQLHALFDLRYGA